MKTYLVGGAVRDHLLGRKPKDEDYVVVGATPEKMIELGFTQVGADFPVFLKDGQEYALARQERKVSKGYKGFTTNHSPNVTIEEDLLRRDLTINAMAMTETGEIIDPYGGQKDLKNKILRHVSEAFAEDPLRVLRVARFAARYDFSVAPETKELMRKLVDNGELNHLTKERVWTELEKAIMEDYPVNFFFVLLDCGALNVLFPELNKNLFVTLERLRIASLRSVSRNERLVILFHRVKSFDSFLKRYTIPSDVIKLIRKFQAIDRLLWKRTAIRGWVASAEDVVNVLENINAYKCPAELFLISNIISLLSSENMRDTMDVVLMAYHFTKNITFDSLPNKNELQGKYIGLAIHEKRIQVVEEKLWTKKARLLR